MELFWEKAVSYLQALAGEPVHFLKIKAKSFLPLISKATGQELELSDLKYFWCCAQVES